MSKTGDHYKDLSGKRFGMWTVIDGPQIVGEGKNKVAKWLCRCDCGTERWVLGASLTAGRSKGCGHDRKTRYKDLRGQRFGKLVVMDKEPEIEVIKNGQSRLTRWWCKCDCGNEVLVLSQSLQSGATKSCGCTWWDTRQGFIAAREAIHYDGTNIAAIKETKPNPNNKSGYRGVSWDAKAGKYIATIMIRGERHRLGWFDDPKEAAKAYREAKKIYHEPIVEEWQEEQKKKPET